MGYLVKATPLPDIRRALLEVLAGGSPMSPTVAWHVVRYLRPTAPAALLTAREQQVVEAIEQGLSYKQVADRLGMALNTVRSYHSLGLRKAANQFQGRIAQAPTLGGRASAAAGNTVARRPEIAALKRSPAQETFSLASRARAPGRAARPAHFWRYPAAKLARRRPPTLAGPPACLSTEA